MVQKWKLVWDLGLEGLLALEWEYFLKSFCHSGISLMDEDGLQWAFNKHNGIVTTNLAYKDLETKDAITPVAKFKKII